MGELTPIDVRKGTVKDALQALQDGIVQTHGCLEQFITEQERHNAAQELAMLTAAEKREESAHALAELRGEVRGLTLALGVRKPAADDDAPKTPTVKADMGWKEHGKMALTILGSLGGFVLFLQIIAPGIAATWDAIMKASP